jgi:asparagine synthase (glutamine-hydrolysing)
MCGFIGSARFDGRPSPAVPAQVATRIRWRGPDSYVEQTDHDHILASARLAVIDLAPEADQPLTTDDGAWELVFNGEIYNYQQLAAQHGLSDRARRSDSWTVLELVGLLGVDQARRSLRGMYAFAAWERAASRLWLARDPLGIKPLTWTRVDGSVLFASDPRSLASWRRQLGAPCGLDAYAITHFLMLGYIPGDASAWEDVERLSPGALLAIDAHGTALDVWEPLDDQPSGDMCTVDVLDAAIRDSISRHLVADVELGAFLSGGIDSSLVVSIARREFDAPIRTYSVGFDSGAVTNETAAAERMAAELGTLHTSLHLSAADCRNLLASVVEAFPEPHADPAAMPTMALSQRAREDVKVVLTGEGGDELFGGYRRYWALPLARGRVGRTAGALGLAAIAARVGGRRLRQVADSVTPGSPGEAYLRYLTQLHWRAMTPVSGLCTPSLVGRVIERYELDAQQPPTARSMRLLELRRHLPESYLEKCDRATMRHGLEARVPFLDLDLVAVALRIHHHHLARPGRTKVLLRQVAARHLPAKVARGPKQGFSVPLQDWLAVPSTASWIREALLGGEATQRGVLDAVALPGVLRDLTASPGSAQAEAMYRLLCLELWYQSARRDGAV